MINLPHREKPKREMFSSDDEYLYAIAKPVEEVKTDLRNHLKELGLPIPDKDLNKSCNDLLDVL